MKKLVCSLLIYSALFSFILISCKSENAVPADGTQSDTLEVVSEEKAAETEVAPLPDNNFDGKSFTIF